MATPERLSATVVVLMYLLSGVPRQYNFFLVAFEKPIIQEDSFDKFVQSVLLFVKHP